MHLPVDVIDVELDESRLVSFVTHLIGHDLGWRSIVVAMNVDFWRSYQLGPRSHPGDGVIDVYRAKLSPGDIFKIAPRAKMGLHVPHPKIELQRSSEVLVRVPRQVRLWTDDIKIGTARSLRFSVRPDALTVVI
jgi:diacylglycerol kinase family enzyme